MITDRIQEAETRWPQLRFRKKTADEASSSCPFCNQGDDRFLIFDDGGYWCRQCESKGWLDEENSEWSQLDPLERRVRLLEAEQRRARREREEQARQLSALQRMMRCTDHLKYHDMLDWDAIEYWHDEGMNNDTIDTYKLGFCPRCPTDRDRRASYTIPVFGRDGETLINIRHRLIGSQNGDKYRPHMAGLGAQLFNAKHTQLATQSIIVTEGEKKSLVLEQERFPNVAIMGARSFKKEWLTWLAPFEIVYVALDPDALDSARRLAAMFDGRGRIVDLPCKVDDMIVQYGATRDDLQWFMDRARPVRGTR